MGIDLRKPNINAGTQREQIEQIRSYLYQLTDQLQWALNTVDGGKSSSQSVRYTSGGGGTGADVAVPSNFGELKSLIIKSADIVSAYCKVISRKLEGVYVAQSDFGTYKEETSQEIEENSTSINRLFENLQEISETVDGMYDSTVSTSAHIKSGYLYDDENGFPVYGLEIGQKSTANGMEVFNKFARFTSGKLSFYDANDVEVAYISDYRLYINDAQINGTLTLGGYRVDTSDGLIFRWIGGTS